MLVWSRGHVVTPSQIPSFFTLPASSPLALATHHHHQYQRYCLTSLLAVSHNQQFQQPIVNMRYFCYLIDRL
ncbi:uncharacterized protein LY79DRAFT_549167 [Colletotrichum navitas]|uniref:Uncharacterized protein n=1 Tax=Colletotrichum navitas TaxID=681940 RepID=A0AAD8V6S5_9PEZI|nr:uncharacterized protein LY79DRAFT_549167 [Colletotrichum navitas]KAK1594603.1 hypothetical protein LY79DRAFT_549167 [Colletotrichum navitas]